MIEETILGGLIGNEDFAREVSPFIKSEYFEEESSRVLFEEFEKHLSDYSTVPTKDVLAIMVEKRENLDQTVFSECMECLDRVEYDPNTNIKWLKAETEKYCQDRALYNAIRQSIAVIDGEDKKIGKGALPSLLNEALAVSFDTKVGHDYFDDVEARWDYYNSDEERIPTNLDIINKITNGGLARKSLSIIMAGTGVGKSLLMCSTAAGNVMDGLNVLYITLELSEEEVARRIDANFLDTEVQKIKTLDKKSFVNRVNRVRSRSKGKLVIQEYPTTTAGANHFRFLLNDLKLKKDFVPDVIYIDYINICVSSRIKSMSGVNSYTYIKAIAEELRGLAVEFNVPIVSATQTNRSGIGAGDLELTDTAECIFVDEMVTLRTGEHKRMGDLALGDQILSNDGYKTIIKTHHPKIKDCVKITTKSGKSIITSKDHIFPTQRGRISLNSGGLSVGDFLSTK